jgi:hypothetical protein
MFSTLFAQAHVTWKDTKRGLSTCHVASQYSNDSYPARHDDRAVPEYIWPVAVQIFIFLTTASQTLAKAVALVQVHSTCCRKGFTIFLNSLIQALVAFSRAIPNYNFANTSSATW